MTFSFSVILSTELSSLRSGEFLLFFQNCYVYPLCLLYLCSYTGINLRPPIQQSTLKYEKQFPSRHPTTLHYQMLQFLGGFAFLARRALIPEAESNLWCLTHDVVSQIHLSPPLPSLLLCLSWWICSMAWCPNECSFSLFAGVCSGWTCSHASAMGRSISRYNQEDNQAMPQLQYSSRKKW